MKLLLAALWVLGWLLLPVACGPDRHPCAGEQPRDPGPWDEPMASQDDEPRLASEADCRPETLTTNGEHSP